MEAYQLTPNLGQTWHAEIGEKCLTCAMAHWLYRGKKCLTYAIGDWLVLFCKEPTTWGNDGYIRKSELSWLTNDFDFTLEHDYEPDLKHANSFLNYMYQQSKSFEDRQINNWGWLEYSLNKC